MKARFSRTPWFVCLLTAAGLILTSAQEVNIRLGRPLELVPLDSFPALTGILWKHGPNKVAEWDKGLNDDQVDYYGTFKNRTQLDIVKGKLVINNMTIENSGSFSVEINGRVQQQKYPVKVIKDVPKPKVDTKPLSCGPSSASCTLICDAGNVTDSQPVTYSWKKDEGEWTEASDSNQTTISSDKDQKIKYFFCKIQNMFSAEKSDREANKLVPENLEVSNVGGIIGGIVGLLLLLLLLVVGLVCGMRCKETVRNKLVSDPDKQLPDWPWLKSLLGFKPTTVSYKAGATDDANEGPGATDEEGPKTGEPKEVDDPEKNPPPAAASTQSDHGDATKKTTEGPGSTDQTYANVDETKVLLGDKDPATNTGNPQASEATIGASIL